MKQPPHPMYAVARLLAFLIGRAALSGSSAIWAADTGNPAPNILFILVDNCGQEWLGCYGSEEGCTPHIDQLARTGLRAEHCYTPPICGPSRIVALTGRYLLRSGMVLHHDAALYGGGGLDPDRETTFARLLRDAGYHTVLAGKWQVNNLYEEPDVLRRHGFEETLVWPGSIDQDKVTPRQMARFQQAVIDADEAFTRQFISNIENRYWDPVLLRDGRREVHPGKFGPDVLQSCVMDFLRRDHDRPFLLYYPMVLTHGNTFTEPVVATPLNLDPHRDHHAMYADMVRYADMLIGEVIRELERTRLRERTIVFIATDNGTEKSQIARARGRQIQGGLYQLTDAGSDVGLVVNCPALVPGGRTLPLADFSDLLPTFCELAGTTIPSGLIIDGRSFAAFALGTSSTPPRDWIFNQYGSTRVVRDRTYKLYSDGRLFNVHTDFAEEHDLASGGDPAARAAQVRLQAVLNSLPPDSPPPFELRSQSAFRLKKQARD